MLFKRGVSAIVIIGFFIVLSLASVALIYNELKPQLDSFGKTSNQASACLLLHFDSPTCITNHSLTSVSVSRRGGGGLVSELHFVFDAPSGSQVIIRPLTSFLELESKQYVFSSDTISFPQQVAISGVLEEGTLCTLTDRVVCHEMQTISALLTCDDAEDNDQDGWIDMNDPGCESPSDDDESNEDLGVCANNNDDDSDGFVDGFDTLCLTWQGTREQALCQNGDDDDSDGWIDGLDYGCVEDNDDDEYNDPSMSPACSDGIDNDGDLLIDRADLECLSGTQDDEGSIIVQVFECNDGIDNSDPEDSIADYPSDIGCASQSDNNETNEILVCPYGNNLTNYATCDYRLAIQNAYSALPVETYGVQRTAWTVGAYALKAGNSETLAQMLSYNESQIRTTFRNYLNGSPEIRPTDIFLLDIEDELDPELIGSYAYDPVLQAQVIDALKVRVHVARTELPNAKLALWNTIIPDPRGQRAPNFVARMDGYYLAAQRGLFDELDYMLPNVYTRYGPLDTNFNKTLNATRMAIEYSQNITRSDNSTILPLAPILSFHIANGGSVQQNQLVDRTMARRQVELIQTYPSVDIILWWAGNDHYSPGGQDVDIVGYYSEVKPVPALCFCS